MRILVFLIIFIGSLFGQKILQPDLSIIASGDVQDMVVNNNLLYVATNEGKVDIFDITKKELLQSIQIPAIKDFMGKDINAKIYSVDVYDNKILFVSEGESGYRKVWIYEQNKLSKIIDVQSKYFVRKARFITDYKIFMALLTNEHILYDISAKKVIYNTQLSTSSFSDFVLSEDKTKYISSDESGIVRVGDVLSGKVIKEYDGKNVDRVFQVDYKKGVILTAGQDRRAVVYKSFSEYYLEFDFLLYSCALSPSANLAAVAYNIENDVLVYDVNTKDKLYALGNARATITKIIFLNEDELIVSSDSKKINYYKLK